MPQLSIVLWIPGHARDDRRGITKKIFNQRTIIEAKKKTMKYLLKNNNKMVKISHESTKHIPTEILFHPVFITSV